MKHLNRGLAALVALCLLLGGAMGAAAEGFALNDLWSYYQRFVGEAGTEEVPEATPVPVSESPATEGTGLEPDDEIIVPPEQLIQVSDYAVNENLPDSWENILLLGTDSRTTQQYSRTDTMIVLSINPGTSQVKLTSLMRDIWVDIPGHGGAKLNAACVYGGPELTVRCINENFGLNIRYYVLVNMQCLAAIVDSLGGIRMDLSEAEAKAINKLFLDDWYAHDENSQFVTDAVGPGTQLLMNGKQALAYARIRSLDSDYARTDRQRLVLVTIAKQMQQQDILSLAGIVAGMLQYVETNLSLDEIMSIAAAALNADLDALAELRLPAEGTYQSGTYSGTWCIRPDFAENTKILHDFIYG